MAVESDDIWKAIWLADNSTSSKVSDFLRSLLPKRSPVSTRGVYKFAFVVSHNSKRGGAYAPYPINMNEYDFHSLVAKELLKLAEGDSRIEVKLFFRKPLSKYYLEIDECYRRVNAWDPIYTVEAHFNWLAGAGRVEMISYPGSAAGKEFAQIGLDVFSEIVPATSEKLIERGKSDRGGRSLWACKSVAVMSESFDSTDPSHLVAIDKVGVKGVAKAHFDMMIAMIDRS